LLSGRGKENSLSLSLRGKVEGEGLQHIYNRGKDRGKGQRDKGGAGSVFKDTPHLEKNAKKSDTGNEKTHPPYQKNIGFYTALLNA
jgi:hypothetical protein